MLRRSMPASLDQTRVDSLVAEAERALQLIGGTGSDSPREVLARLAAYVAGTFESGALVSEERLRELSALLGCQFERGLGWLWEPLAALEEERDSDSELMLVSADRALAMLPYQWLRDALAGEADAHFQLSYHSSSRATFRSSRLVRSRRFIEGRLGRRGKSGIFEIRRSLWSVAGMKSRRDNTT
jgi:hypothetical protein